jgi:uncharacterized protein (TIGR02001 family)
MPFRPICRVLVTLTLAACMPLHASVISGNVVLTSDYVFRGISQTDASFAPQAGIRIDVLPGFYASAWASRVDLASAPQASAEIDYAIGWRKEVGSDWSADLNATWFTYTDAADLNYLEWIATATWRDRHWITLGASQDVFATGRTGIYAQSGVRIPLADALRFELAGGYYWLEQPYGRSYAHAQATVAWQVHSKVELRLLGHVTDASARDLFGDLAGSRIEATIQASF